MRRKGCRVVTSKVDLDLIPKVLIPKVTKVAERSKSNLSEIL